ncbi:hypothetical protein [Rahnella laticis]|uniref:hypothetical protein n=1 Tax=Rahnella laticis TaxID=2787622 RepID=UPI0018A25DBD|nr:hypothetical protein [Rahnella laticis]MBF7997672.1 hypothetical protein [Rahnella laticis]
MMTLSQEQCQTSAQMEDDEFVNDMAKRIKTRYPAVNIPDDIFKPRLREALSYANTLPITQLNARRDFLMLEAFYPGYYRKPEIEKWLKTPNGDSPDQRLEDFKHVLMNRERRGL